MEIWTALELLLLVVAVALLVIVVARSGGRDTVRILERMDQLERLTEKTDRAIRDEFQIIREENAQNAKNGREEIQGMFKLLSDSLLTRMTEVAALQQKQLESFGTQLTALIGSNENRLDKIDATVGESLKGLAENLDNDFRLNREELNTSWKAMSDTVQARLVEIANLSREQTESISRQINALIQSNETKLEGLRKSLEERMKLLQDDNNLKLEQMRVTVDEKLHATLEQRLGESFKLVSDRLEVVHKGLGEMQVLASGVGDLKRVLTNVKTRGIWGEVQLGMLLEQMMNSDQYTKNACVKEGSQERVDFAVRLPGKGEEGKEVLLPIDAKFPQEDYYRVVDAYESGNPILLEEASRQLEARIRQEAKDISDKYINPPDTTDFALMFLPTESLYAEVLRRPGLIETLQRDYRVTVTGPTTIAALLNSLSLGFRTLAIQKRSGEVWSLLGAVKTEFGRFGDLLDRTKKKLQEASNSIDNASRKSRTIERKLRDVQALPAGENTELWSDLPEEEDTEE